MPRACPASCPGSRPGRTPISLIVRPRLVHRTFLDASLFLMAVPLIGVKALVRDLLWLPIMLYLP